MPRRVATREVPPVGSKFRNVLGIAQSTGWRLFRSDFDPGVLRKTQQPVELGLVEDMPQPINGLARLAQLIRQNVAYSSQDKHENSVTGLLQGGLDPRRR